MRRWLTLLLTTMIAACGAAPDEREAASGNTGLRYLGADFGGDFARATVPRDFVFPEGGIL